MQNPTRSPGHWNMIGGVVLIIALSAIVFPDVGDKWIQILTLLGGIVYGIAVFRLGHRWGWMWFAGIAALVAMVNILEIYALGWAGGFIAGTNFGAAWEAYLWAKKRPKAEWLVNREGFNTASQTKQAALEELRSLDGRKKGSVVIVHDTSTLQLVGSAANGVLVHKSATNTDERSWGVLTKEGVSTSEWKEIPMAGITGAIPLAYIHDISAVESVIDDFVNHPDNAPNGKEWTTGDRAEEVFFPIAW